MRGPFIKAECHPPVGLDRDRIRTAPVASQRVKAEQRQGHILKLFAASNAERIFCTLSSRSGRMPLRSFFSYSRRKPLCLIVSIKRLSLIVYSETLRYTIQGRLQAPRRACRFRHSPFAERASGHRQADRRSQAPVPRRYSPEESFTEGEYRPRKTPARAKE